VSSQFLQSLSLLLSPSCQHLIDIFLQNLLQHNHIYCNTLSYYSFFYFLSLLSFYSPYPYFYPPHSTTSQIYAYEIYYSITIFISINCHTVLPFLFMIGRSSVFTVPILTLLQHNHIYFNTSSYYSFYLFLFPLSFNSSYPYFYPYHATTSQIYSYKIYYSITIFILISRHTVLPFLLKNVFGEIKLKF
jgi:hypothetical protein